MREGRGAATTRRRGWLACAITAACSSSSPDQPAAPPAPAPRADGQGPPPLDRETQREIAREIVAKARIDAGSPRVCAAEGELGQLDVTGQDIVADFGGQITTNATGDAPPDHPRLELFSGPARTGRYVLRPREGAEDYSRPWVVWLQRHVGATLDAVSGTLVIERASRDVLAGHLDDATFREIDEAREYVTGGCTAHVAHATFRFTPRRAP